MQRTFDDFSKSFHTHYLIDFTRSGVRSTLSLGLDALCPGWGCQVSTAKALPPVRPLHSRAPAGSPGPPPRRGHPAWCRASSCRGPGSGAAPALLARARWVCPRLQPEPPRTSGLGGEGGGRPWEFLGLSFLPTGAWPRPRPLTHSQPQAGVAPARPGCVLAPSDRVDTELDLPGQAGLASRTESQPGGPTAGLAGPLPPHAAPAGSPTGCWVLRQSPAPTTKVHMSPHRWPPGLLEPPLPTPLKH